MSDMDGVGGRSAAGIKEERLALLVAVQDGLEVSVGEDDTSSEETVRLLSGYALESGEQILADESSSEFLNQFGVVDCLNDTICADLSRNLATREA